MIRQVLVVLGVALLLSVSYVSSQNCMTEVVREIYAQGNQLSVVARGYFAFGQRENAIMITAAHDALNSINQEYDFYLGVVKPQGMSKGRRKKAHECATIISAYHYAALNITRERRASNSDLPYTTPQNTANFIQRIEDFYASKISQYRGESTHSKHQRRVDDAITLGEAAAHRILEHRYNDGWKGQVPEPTHGPAIGKWVLNVGTTKADYPQWQFVTPFVLSSAREFMAPPPPSVDDPAYLEALEQTKYIGGKTSETAGNRTFANSETARWWNGASNAHVGLVLFILQERQQWDLRKTTAAFCILALAGADQNIAVFNQKAFYFFWRPQHAIKNERGLDYTGHPGIQALEDHSWLPWLPTPNNPEYPAGHPTNTGSGCLTMKSFLGFDAFPGGPVTVSYDNSPGQPIQAQVFSSFTDVQMSVRFGRIWGGMHLLTSVKAGENLAIPIANKVVNRIRAIEDHDDDDDDDD